MPAYLFQLELPDFTEEIVAVVPRHRLHINKLFSEGRILSYSLSIHRNMIWCVVNAEDEPMAMEMILEFPLYPHFIEINCHQLLFHNTLPASLPGIFLN